MRTLDSAARRRERSQERTRRCRVPEREYPVPSRAWCASLHSFRFESPSGDTRVGRTKLGLYQRLPATSTGSSHGATLSALSALMPVPTTSPMTVRSRDRRRSAVWPPDKPNSLTVSRVVPRCLFNCRGRSRPPVGQWRPGRHALARRPRTCAAVPQVCIERVIADIEQAARPPAHRIAGGERGQHLMPGLRRLCERSATRPICRRPYNPKLRVSACIRIYESAVLSRAPDVLDFLVTSAIIGPLT